MSVDRKGRLHCVVCGDIIDGVSVVYYLSEHVSPVVDESREMVDWYLVKMGYHVTSVNTCTAGLILVSNKAFNLYLLGEDCPDGTALDLCRRIRAVDAVTPILICSSRAYPVDHERGIRAGAQAYLTKPCELEKLEQTIKYWITETLVGSLGETCITSAQE